MTRRELRRETARSECERIAAENNLSTPPLRTFGIYIARRMLAPNGQHQRPGASERSAWKQSVIAGFAACNG